MSKTNTPREPFEGFDSPNYTQVHDQATSWGMVR